MLIQLLRCVVSFVPSVEQGTLSWAALFWNDHLCSRPLNFVCLNIIDQQNNLNGYFVSLILFCAFLKWFELKWIWNDSPTSPRTKIVSSSNFPSISIWRKARLCNKKKLKALDWRAWYINRNAILFPPIALQHDSNVIFSLRILQSLACLQSLTLFETAFHRKTLPYKLYIFSVYILFVHQLVDIIREFLRIFNSLGIIFFIFHMKNKTYNCQ